MNKEQGMMKEGKTARKCTEVEVEDIQPGMVTLYRPSPTGEGKGMRPGFETVRSVANDERVLNNES